MLYLKWKPLQLKLVFMGVPHPRFNWNLEMLVFQEGGKLENPVQNPWCKVRTNNKLNPHMAPGWNRSSATVVGGKCSRHCTIPILHYLKHQSDTTDKKGYGQVHPSKCKIDSACFTELSVFRLQQTHFRFISPCHMDLDLWPTACKI